MSLDFLEPTKSLASMLKYLATVSWINWDEITLSLDDFIVTAFTRGSGLLSGSKNIETLSTLVQAKIKKGPIPPEMRALTTILFVAVIAAVIGITIYRNHQEKKLNLSKRRAG